MSVFAGNLPFNFSEEALRALFAGSGEIVGSKIVKRGKDRSLGYGFVDFANGVNVDNVASKFNKHQIEGREIVVEVARPKVEREAKERKPRAPREPREPKANNNNGGSAGGAAGGDGTRPPRRRGGRGRGGGGGRGSNAGDNNDNNNNNNNNNNNSNNNNDASGEGQKRRRRRPAPEKEKLPMIKDHGVFVANLPFNVDHESLKAIFDGSGVNVVAAHIITRRTGRSKGYGFAQFASDSDRDKALKFAAGKKLGDRELSVSAVKEESNHAAAN